VISEGDPSAFHKTAVSTAIQTDRYTCPATLGVTIVPSGGTTTKNGFNGPGVAECSALSPLMEESSLAISDRIKLPNEKVVFSLSSPFGGSLRKRAVLPAFLGTNPEQDTAVFGPGLKDSPDIPKAGWNSVIAAPDSP
jgi:hypothetical protein